jgi:hypothetical protein
LAIDSGRETDATVKASHRGHKGGLGLVASGFYRSTGVFSAPIILLVVLVLDFLAPTHQPTKEDDDEDEEEDWEKGTTPLTGR